MASTCGQGMASFTHVHCAHAAIVEEEDMTVYLEQGSAAFNALPEVNHHSTALSGSQLPAPRDSTSMKVCSRNDKGTFAISCNLDLNPCLYSSLHIALSCIK